MACKYAIPKKNGFQFSIMFFTKRAYFAVYVTYGVVLLISVVNGWRPFRIIISNITVETFLPKCQMNASVADSGIFNIYVSFPRPIRNPFMHTEIHLDSHTGNYDMELLNHTVDLCKWYKSKNFKPLVSSCPLNKGVYYLKNVELNVEKFPPFFPEKRGVFKSIVSENQERLYCFKILFHITKTFNKNRLK